MYLQNACAMYVYRDKICTVLRMLLWKPVAVCSTCRMLTIFPSCKLVFSRRAWRCFIYFLLFVLLSDPLSSLRYVFVCLLTPSLTFLCMFVYQFVSLSRFPPFYIFFLSSLRLCDPFFSPSSFLPPFFGSLWPFDLTSPGRLCCLADDPTAVRSTTWTTWGHLHLS